MDLKMTIPELFAFLASDFPQVQGDYTIESLTPDLLVTRLKVTERHLRPGGTVSGPSIFALADISVYLAVLSRLGPVALAVTTNCSIDFMRKPAAGTDMLCRTRILKLGRSLAVGDVLMFSDGLDDPVARATLTYAIPPAR